MNFQIVCTGLTSKAMINKYQMTIQIVQPFIPSIREKNPQERLHVALISESGSLIDVHINGMKMIKLNWTLKVPDSKSYFGFTAKRKIYLIYGDNKKITLLKSNKFHRTIPNSKLPIADDVGSNFGDWNQYNKFGTKFNYFNNKLSIYGAHAAVGEFIWILGKKTDNYLMHGTSSSGIES